MKTTLKFLALLLVFAMLIPMALACSDDEAPTEVTVTFESAGGSTVAPVTVMTGEKITKPTDPTRTGYTFDGWYNGDEAWSFSAYRVTEEMTLTAKWAEIAPVTSTVTFNCNGGAFSNGDTTAVSDIIGRTKAPMPENPTRTGYTFDGWYNGEEKWSFSAYYVEEDITLTARWIIDNPADFTYTVTFNSDGAGEVLPQTVRGGEFADAPVGIEREGYILLGWYNGDEKWNFSTDAVMGDITLVARWRSESDIVVVSFNSDGALTATINGEAVVGKSFYYVAARARANGFAGMTSEEIKLAMV